MSKSKNISFIENYILLERAADGLMRKTGGGISSYISALERQKLNTGAAETLRFLKKCRIVRNKLAHDPGALKDNNEITKKDTKRIIKLTAAIKSQKDPLSKILKKKKRLPLKIKAAIVAAAAVLLSVCAVILYLNQI